MIEPSHARPRREDFSIPPAAPDFDDPSDAARAWQIAERRRVLRRWVALPVAASIAICVAAVVRFGTRDGAAREADVVLALPARASASITTTSAEIPATPATALGWDALPPVPAPATSAHAPAPPKCPKRTRRGPHGTCVR